MIKVGMLVGLILLIGLCGLFENNGTVPQYKPANENVVVASCDNIECMQGKLDACSPAEMTEQNEQGKVYMKIKGRSSMEDCIVYIRLDEINPQLIPEEYQMFAGTVKGSDMTCALDQDDIDLLKSGEMPDETMLEKCDGPLKSLLQLAISQQ